MNLLLIFLGKSIVFLSRFLDLGHGSTWPGHVALSINKNFIKEVINKNSHLKTILIAGTNGKTTTGKLIQTILEKSGKKVFQNESGANLLNGIASSLLLHSSILCKINYDFAILEIDENILPLILKEIKNPDFILILNLFRDQLDRYGEVNTIAKKWENALKKLNEKTTLILNADDPLVACLNLHLKGANVKPLGWKDNTFFFGLEDKKTTALNRQHASDSTYCPNCNSKLLYSVIFYSHLGIWKCPKCDNQRPELNQDNSPLYPLPGTYNRYNTIAAVLLARKVGLKENAIETALQDFKPAFGRQEIINVGGKTAHLFLSKNPISFNQSLQTIAELKAKNLLIVLNDRIPDGRDISWIWDVDFEDFSSQFNNITISGDRTFDMGLRLKYAESKKFETEENLTKAINIAIGKTSKNEILYILPTYSAMLETRKILTGKKIL